MQSKYNLDETTKSACTANSTNRASFLEFLVRSNKKVFFSKKNWHVFFFFLNPGIVFIRFGGSFGNLELWFEETKEKRL